MSFLSWSSNVKALNLSQDEVSIIRSLANLARHWPIKLGLFSWNGKLHIIRLNGQGQFPIDNMTENTIAIIDNIPNDGGDPD